MEPEKWYELRAFVPQESLDEVRGALCDLRFGQLGGYCNCMSWWPVTSTWLPLEGANPYRGTVGEAEVAPEYVLQLSCPASQLQDVVAAIRLHHPYEVPVINVVELAMSPVAQPGDDGFQSDRS